MLVAAAADLVPHLQWRGVVTGRRHIVDCATQCQRALIETVGPSQHFGAAQPQRLEQLVRCTARAGQRQAVEHRVHP
ncbi:hypothetical protein D3C79_1066530 [compost metagenome]